MKTAEVHSLGYHTIVFVLGDYVQVDAKSTCSFETEDVFQGVFPYFREGIAHVNHAGTTPDTT